MIGNMFQAMIAAVKPQTKQDPRAHYDAWIFKSYLMINYRPLAEQVTLKARDTNFLWTAHARPDADLWQTLLHQISACKVIATCEWPTLETGKFSVEVEKLLEQYDSETFQANCNFLLHMLDCYGEKEPFVIGKLSYNTDAG